MLNTSLFFGFNLIFFGIRYRDIIGKDKEEFYLFVESMANATYINFENIREFESIKVSVKTPPSSGQFMN